MVKIIGGEVVQDDDPRLRAPSRPAPEAGPSARRRQPAGGPPAAVRAVPAPPGTAFLNLPDLEVYGRRVRSLHLALAAGSAVVFGPRALLVVALLWMISAGGDRPPGDRPPAGRAAAGATRAEVQDFVANYMSRPPPRLRRERGEPGPGSAAGGAVGRGGGAGGRLGGNSGISRLLGGD